MMKDCVSYRSATPELPTQTANWRQPTSGLNWHQQVARRVLSSGPAQGS